MAHNFPLEAKSGPLTRPRHAFHQASIRLLSRPSGALSARQEDTIAAGKPSEDEQLIVKKLPSITTNNRRSRSVFFFFFFLLSSFFWPVAEEVHLFKHLSQGYQLSHIYI